MTPQKRTALVRWVLIAAVLVAVLLQWPELYTYNLVNWLLFGSLALLVAAIHNLGIITPNHEITFLPVAAMMAYLTSGVQAAPIKKGAAGEIESPPSWMAPSRRSLTTLISWIESMS